MAKEHHYYNVIKGLLEVATLVGQIQNAPVMPGSGEAVAPDLGLTASANELLERILSLQGKSMRVAVVGAVSRGKSTLINALLGEERLPDDMEACTGVITEVVYGTNVDEVMLVEKDKRRMMPHTEFLNTVRLTPEEQRSLRDEKAFVMPDRLTKINYAVLETEYPLGEKGLHIVDTLGFRAGTDAEKITKAFLTQADVLVFVTRAHPVFEEADEAFLKTQLRRNESRLEHIFFVINDFSGLDASERAKVMATARVRLKDYFLTPDDKFDEALFERRVFIVDARIALGAQLDGEKGDAPESTGLPAFARAMQQMMEDGEYLSIKLKAAIVETLIPALNEAMHDIANKRRHLISNKRGRDTGQVTSEMSRLEAIEARLSELFDQISYEVYGRVLTAEEHRQMGVAAALISHKEMAKMHHELGSLALANADYKQALTEFSKGLDLDPDSEEIYVGIAEAHFGLEALEDAEQAARKALSLNPDSQRSQAVLDKCSQALERKRALAIKALQQGADKRSPTLKSLNNLKSSVIPLMGNRHQSVFSVSISPDGTLVSSGGVIGRIWNIRTKENIAKLPRDWSGVFTSPINSVFSTFSPDGSHLASAGMNGKIHLWEVGVWKKIDTFSEPRARGQGWGKYTTWIRPLTFSPTDTLLASGISDANVRLWDVVSGENMATFQGHKKAVYSVAFSPDGLLLASGGDDGNLKLSDVRTGRNMATFQSHKKAVYSVAFSPDGRLLASGGDDGNLKLWDVVSGENMATFQSHKKAVYAVAFSPDGLLLASGGDGDNLKLWDVEAGEGIATLQSHKKAIYSVAFSPNGELLASGGGDGALKLWNLS